jgi:16S rRNA (cytosine1402-N4)-methyltransferase
VLAALAPRDDAVYVDATFGAGGYSEALLGAARCRVFGIDRDPDAVARGQALAEKHGGRLTLIAGPFGDMERLIGPFQPGAISGIAFDLGVSSMQLDIAERGFSFRHDGPLDMRMSRDGASAADLLARLPERELATLIATLGEERFARRIARALAAAQQRQPLATTSELAEIVRAAIPKREPGLDPATRTFQALRIAVNDELGELDRGLAAAERLLMPGGGSRSCRFIHWRMRGSNPFCAGAARLPTVRATCRRAPRTARRVSCWQSRRPVRPGADDDRPHNPRARSARLRSAERTAAPAFRRGGTDETV